MDLLFDTTTQEYIEVIFALEKENKVARVTDIARRRGVTKSSVSLVLNHLQEKNLVDRKQYGYISLTLDGRQLAETLQKRHQTIKQFFTLILGLELEIAEQDACQIEHVISQQTLNSIDCFLKFIKECPQPWDKILSFFPNCSKFNQGSVDCSSCPKIDIQVNKPTSPQHSGRDIEK